MKKQRYLIARFTKDLRRKEARNIGVILWTRHQVATKFLDASQILRLEADKQLYSRWISFWETTCQSESINLGRRGEFFRRNPDFLDALMQSQRGNFSLVELGFVREQIGKNDVDSVLNHLFSDLVDLGGDADGMSRISTSRQLANQCKLIFEQSGLLNDPKFSSSKSFVPCLVGKARRDFPINYLYGSERKPLALFQRVNLCDERSIDSTSYVFERLVKSSIIDSKERCGALFEYPSDSEPISGAEAQLAEHCMPIDVSYTPDAVKMVESVAYGRGLAI